MNLQAKLCVGVGAVLVAVLGGASWYLHGKFQDVMLEDLEHRGRAIVGGAEEARSHTAELHASGAIDAKSLFARAKEEMQRNGGDYSKTAAFATIPVVAGMGSAKAAAKAAEMDLAITAFDARNPDHDPAKDKTSGAFRSDLLKDLTAQVKSGGSLELSRIDPKTDTLHFMRAIKLTQNCMTCHGDPATSESADGKDPLGFRMENWHVGDVHGAYEVVAPLAPFRAESNSWLVKVALIAVLLGALGAGGFVWFSRTAIVKPLQSVQAAFESMAAGDLTVAVTVKGDDEIAQTTKSLRTFQGKLGEMMREINRQASSVTAAAEELTATASTLAEGAEKTQAQSTQAAAAAEQMSANMNSVGTSADSMTGSIRTVAAAVEQMTASIAEVSKNAGDAASVAGTAAQLTRSSNEKVAALGAAANEIGRVIETIQDIAEQTNLLALNATIEAARAGEAGKGFSVVANEVKDLARQTADATQDIRQRIERIQASTAESVAAIGEIDQVIAKVSTRSQQIAAAVGEQRTATQEIAQNLAQSTSAIEVVGQNVKEGVATSREITKAITEVDTLARSTAAASEETSAAGHSLTGIAEQLAEMVGRFKV